jgi:hypothetical protein
MGATIGSEARLAELTLTTRMGNVSEVAPNASPERVWVGCV